MVVVAPHVPPFAPRIDAREGFSARFGSQGKLPPNRRASSFSGGGPRTSAAELGSAMERRQNGFLDPMRATIDRQKSSVASLRERCGACGAADGGGVRLRACDACDAVRYCGRECQLADWQAHQLVCKILASDREILVGGPGWDFWSRIACNIPLFVHPSCARHKTTCLLEVEINETLTPRPSPHLPRTFARPPPSASPWGSSP